ncbi:unnamed protein product [Phytomonas sp. EM1]|nr:unnamed protein product [Phytomonas sp. EM1]|eukprot:CCW60628.1 unnamed protein product [Phytomonas sp. isolate EM1]
MLKFSFTLDDELASNLCNFLNTTSSSSVIVTIKNEEMKMLCDPIPSTGILSYNLKLLRLALRRYDTKFAYIVIRLPKGPLCLVIYIAENSCSSDSMKYLFGESNLSNSLKPHEFFTVRVHSVEEIQPNLFENLSKETNHDDLMTESERLHKKISEMEVAPQVQTLPVTLIPLSEGARDVVLKYAVGLVDTVTFMIVNNEITVDRILEGQFGDLAALKDILPENYHRYVLTRYKIDDSDESKDIMIYICPLSSDVKERMLYASAKAAFISFANDRGINFHLKKEAANYHELVSVVKEAFSDSVKSTDEAVEV